LIVTGKDRQDAIERSRRALTEFEVAGLPTVLPFHRAILDEPDFNATKTNDFKVHTTWIENDFANQIEPWSGSIQETELEEDLYRTVVVEVEGRRLRVGVPAGIFSGGGRTHLGRAPKRALSQHVATSSQQNQITAPMQATVVKVSTSVGAVVVQGDTICVLEAMKMEQPIVAQSPGVISTLGVMVGDSVQIGHVIAVIEPPRNDRPRNRGHR
jgi:acetyl-CoA/propionyl-CoA carboxylase biotin carboxyl carrier protein